jgi:hypothetical protein
VSYAWRHFLAAFAGNDRQLAETIFTFQSHPQHSSAA